MSVFNTIYAGQYDQLYAVKDYDLECRLINEAAARHGLKFKTMLDVGCGTGGHALRFAEQGVTVTGIDASEGMLTEARAKANKNIHKFEPSFELADARNFNLGKTFDLVVMMFAVFSYMEKNEDQLAALKSIRQHLRAGSLFMCDFWYGPAVLTERPSERIREIPLPGGNRLLRAAKTSIDTFGQTADVTFKLWNLQGQKVISETEETHRMRFVFPQEFIRLLTFTGFELLTLSAFPTLDEPATDHTWNVFAVARAV